MSKLVPFDKITPKLKKRWVKALRSGAYKQGKSRLCSPDGKFCCLGVLAHIQRVKEEDLREWTGDQHYSALHGKSITYFEAILASVNDGGYTFAEIADHIEENLDV